MKRLMTWSLCSAAILIGVIFALDARETTGCMQKFKLKQLVKPSHHDMAKHAYSEGAYLAHGQIIAELEYIDDVPVIFTYLSDPYLTGQVISHFTFEGNLHFQQRYVKWLTRFIRVRFPSFLFTNPLKFIADEADRLNFKIPMRYASEVTGIFDDYNEKVDKLSSFSKRRPIQDPELQTKLTAATDVFLGFGICSSALRRAGEDVELYRNLDWGTMGILGTYSFVVVRRLDNNDPDYPRATLSFSIPPGQAGLTVANDKGLVVALHEVNTMKTKRNLNGGMPEAFLCRWIAEKCVTVEEAIWTAQTVKPASSHTLVIKDASGKGAIIQLLPARSIWTSTVRDLQEDYIAVTNHHFDEEGQVIDGSQAARDSEKRYAKIMQALEEEATPEEILLSVDKADTLHSILFYQKNGEMHAKVVFDNCHAAKGAYRELNVTQLLERVLTGRRNNPL